MFYSQLILARKGPLGKVWLAAHWDKKLTKMAILDTDISESVENILNPSSPLALRLSGHLMLGVVRIYARKVKYLMSDVTEVMWKVKMAYKVNSSTALDLVDTTATAAIDDPRFFGNVQPDYDFPELAELAFSQNMLTQYNELRAARGRTLNTHEMKRSIGSSPLVEVRGREKSLRLANEDEMSTGGSVLSRVSEVELMRGERSRSTLLSAARTSMSSAGMRFIEDEIPAYVEDPDYPMELASHVPERELYEPALRPSLSASIPSFSPPALHGDDRSVHTPVSVNPASEESSVRQVTVRRKATGKRRRPLITEDQRVELPSSLIKSYLEDRTPILRRKPGDKLPRRLSAEERLSPEQLLSMPNMRGLCPELLELYSMTMTMGALPFPPVADQGKRVGDESESEEEPEVARFSVSEGMPSRPSYQEITTAFHDEGNIAMDLEPINYEAATGDYSSHESAQRPPYEPAALIPSPLNISDGSNGSKASAVEGLDSTSALEELEKKISTETRSVRTIKVIEVLKNKFAEKEEIRFDELTGGNRSNRKNAAAYFFEVLQLNTWGLIDAQQTEPFGEIKLRPLEKMWATS